MKEQEKEEITYQVELSGKIKEKKKIEEFQKELAIDNDEEVLRHILIRYFNL